jgi:ACS family tartrate transporter-like MFS transporter
MSMSSNVARPAGAATVEPIEAETMRRVARRLIPLLMVSYFAAYLDRVNVGFAALTMNKSLGFSAEVFGIGSGIFFLGYFLFEVPSNLILSKVGARKWIARILLTWGVISGATAFVTGTCHSSASASCSVWPRPASIPASFSTSPGGSRRPTGRGSSGPS